jgi:hypothetical protein
LVNGPVVLQTNTIPVLNANPGISEMLSVLDALTCHQAAGVTAPSAGAVVALNNITHSDALVVLT